MPHVTRHKHNACQAVSILLLFLWLSPTSALAHPEGFSGLHVTITADRMRVAITLHTRDLGTWFPPGKYPDYVADVTRDMEQTIGEIIELQIDEQPLPIGNVEAFLLEVGLIEIDVDYKLPPSADTVELLVWSKHLIQMPRGHQQLLFIEDCREMAADAEHGVMRLEDVLTAERDAGAVLLLVMYDGVPRPSNKSPNPPPEDSTALEGHRTGEARQPKPRPDAATEHRSSRISFFLLGVEHIIKDDEEVSVSEPNQQDVHFQWTDPNPTVGKTSYYYVRGEQVADLDGASAGELVWASPMWILVKEQ